MADHFVRHPIYGIGRIAGGGSLVWFFDAPGIDEIAMPFTSDFTIVQLEHRQRVWFKDAGWWLTGYADSPSDNGDVYLVDLTQGGTKYISADLLRVRRRLPLVDPLPFLKAGVVESKGFHDGRAAFVGDIMRQRAASQGLAGIWSSGVELHAHQIGAARRVLADPVKRYLLADEVGLGKTVEAGMILRQLMMDEAGDILVIAPDGLVAQWDSELHSKFRVDQYPNRVSIAAHSEVPAIDAAPRLLVVVDEAHRLTALDADVDHSYTSLCAITKAAKCLLLLSATPVRSNEDGFLRMLHLLDPTTYPLDDIANFRRRVEIRDDLAQALASMSDETPVRFLNEPATTLRRLLPNEQWLACELDLLDTAITSRDAATARAISRRVHTRLSETHRIHRRLIRTRRSGSLAKLFPVRGRTGGKKWLLADPDTRRTEVQRLMEDLRMELYESNTVNPAAAFRAMLGRAMAPITALADAAIALRAEPGHDLDAAEAAALDGLTDTPVGRSLANRIDQILTLGTENDRFDVMIEWAWPHIGVRRVAVATSFPATAEAAALRLETQFGSGRVVRLLSTMSVEARDEAGSLFLAEPSRSIVVIDRGSEEGLNLQVVEEVLHLDLPVSNARLEQRLGRFDRWAPRGSAITSPVRSTVFSEADERLDAHLGAWRRVLDEGVDIFGQSSATLQYVLPELENGFIELALDSGLPDAAKQMVARRDDLEAQRRRIEGQDLLDTIEDRADDQHLADSMQSTDGSPRISGKFRDYVVKTLRFTEDVGKNSTRFGISSRQPPRLTESQIHQIGPDHLRRRYASRRAAAVDGIGLLRWGEPMVNRFVDLAMMDERGRAFAIEVRQPRRDPQSVLTFFRFNVIVTPGPAPVDHLYAKDPAAGAAATARLGQLFPPRLETVWWHSIHGEPDERARQALASATGHDLGVDPERFHHLTYGLDWQHLCERAAAGALRVAAQRDAVQETAAAAAAGAEVMLAHESAILQAHLDASAGPTLDAAVLRAVVAAVQNPHLAIDACGVVLITDPSL
ncbi:protein DpdE [Micromonospora sp. NBC_01699]|uniref:protein DpdE n=1 Tax=Micromonospora sp. NBC_01699 TaxID=2975984 RepID=UPI002E2C88FB|nr:protein DpdE [Micromonospora sp. NBC_01699]